MNFSPFLGRFVARRPTIFPSLCRTQPGRWLSVGLVGFLLPVLLLFAQDPPLDGLNPGADDGVFSLGIAADGKILLGGLFHTLDRNPRGLMGRLNVNGTVDRNFDVRVYGLVYSLVLQADGRILVGGNFSQLSGQPRDRIGRLNADGTLDFSFNPGADNLVNVLLVQADGSILVGGDFANLGGQSRHRIGRMQTDGALDLSFNPGADGAVLSLAVQPDGKILVGGNFNQLAGQPRGRIGRLNADGTLDLSFNPSVEGTVYSLVAQADGKILVGGFFSSLAGQRRSGLGRLNADGAADAIFDPRIIGAVNTVAVQADGKILVGGKFTALAGQARQGLGRLNADGTLDETFTTEASGINPWVYALGLLEDGQILVGGEFKTLGGQRRERIARLTNTTNAVQYLNYEGSTLTWLRDGTSPEVWRTHFEYTTNSVDWVGLGPGTRTPGGWQVSEVSLPSEATLRARGYVTGGIRNASGWFVEGFWGRPWLPSPPKSRTNDAGTTAWFEVGAGGVGPFRYQWFKDGVQLVDADNVSGANTARLTLDRVLNAHAGTYRVAVANSFGSVTSQAAMLTIRDPVITEQPVPAQRDVGESVILSVSVAGTEPLGFQWWKDGAALGGATRPRLSLDNLRVADAGNYQVVVSGHDGNILSQIASLTVNGSRLDDTFNSGADSTVFSLAMQVDGKILVGGYFRHLNGLPRNFLGRLTTDGAVDNSFDPGADSTVNCLTVQPDGKILVGGWFNNLGGQPRTGIGRLNSAGALDRDFNPGVNGTVYSLVVQADGKILVGGYFTVLAGQTRYGLGRLNSDGTLDVRFNPGEVSPVDSLAVQSDGKILVGGRFTTLGGQSRIGIGRLNPDGTLDHTFDPGPDGEVNSLVVQADGRILVGGTFTKLGGQSRQRIARLNADGTIDPSFDPGAIGRINSLVPQADGKILVGGYFSALAGGTRYSLGRLNPDGTLDNTFNPGANGEVNSLVLQADGRILVGGGFTILDGKPCERLGRLGNPGLASQNVNFDGAAITWLRNGPIPEVWRTTFEYSAEGLTWDFLGHGSRVPGGWELTGVNLPMNGTVRARGYSVGGTWNASGSVLESSWQPGPDLSISHFESPREALPGSVQTVSWTVFNQGREPAVLGWVDRIYLSDDPIPGDDWLLGEFPVPGPLSSAATLQRVENIVVPADVNPSRTYWWIVVTDATQDILEENEGNNVRVAEQPMRIPWIPAPQLSVELLGGSFFRFTLRGEAAGVYTVQSATNLALEGWTSVREMALTNGWGTFDWPSTGEPGRYFRAVEK